MICIFYTQLKRTSKRTSLIRREYLGKQLEKDSEGNQMTGGPNGAPTIQGKA